jgi:acetolactate synthase-1/2/3 large subunit
MLARYGYYVAADLQSGCRYDLMAKALGANGELVTDPDDIGGALDRAFASGETYLVNVLTDPSIAYPRTSF